MTSRVTITDLRNYLAQDPHLWLSPLIVIGLLLITPYILCILKFADKSGWIPVLVCIATIIGLRSWRAGRSPGPGRGFGRLVSGDGSDWFR